MMTGSRFNFQPFPCLVAVLDKLFPQQYTLVTTEAWWCCAAGKVTVILALQCQCVTKSVMYPLGGLTLSPPIPLRLYTLSYWSNPLFLIFDIQALWCSGLSTRAPECQTENGGLDQYGIGPFKQQQFGTDGIERVNSIRGEMNAPSVFQFEYGNFVHIYTTFYCLVYVHFQINWKSCAVFFRNCELHMQTLEASFMYNFFPKHKCFGFWGIE